MTMRRIFTGMMATLMMFACATAQAEISGNLEKEQIRDVVWDHIDEVRYCYNKALEQDPELTVKLVVDFTIGEDGAVTHSAISSSDGPAELGNCVSAAVSSWQFPQPDGGGEVVVSYPFVMEPG